MSFGSRFDLEWFSIGFKARNLERFCGDFSLKFQDKCGGETAYDGVEVGGRGNAKMAGV